MKKEKTVDEYANLSFDTMNDKQMESLLVELSSTIFWQAILRFNRTRDGHAINSLASIDPVKEPTLIARTQGMRAGTYSIEQEVNRLNKDRKEAEDKNNTEVPKQ